MASMSAERCEDAEMAAEVRRLARERDAVILAHNYQLPEVQDLADFVGDSLELARWAVAAEASTVILCGVRFMAETAHLLAPEKTVILPEPEAGCPMAEMALPEQVERWRREHPEAAVVGYVNTTAATKAVCDICCTSANAVRVVESLAEEVVLFLPDRNLGSWVARHVRKRVVCHPGFCIVHERVRPDDVRAMKARHPSAKVMAHPECPPAVLDLADTVQSTSGMVRYVASSPEREFIVVTESGMNHRLRRLFPDRVFHSMERGMLCANMKRTTLVSVLRALRGEGGETVRLPAGTAEAARRPLERMMALG